MRRVDEPIDPDIAAQLEAIDATLAGQPVDPEHAELAELALLLAAERPEPADQFAAQMDERVGRRFEVEAAVRRRRHRLWVLAPSAAGLAATAGVVVALSAGGTGTRPTATVGVAVPAQSATGASQTATAAEPSQTATTPAGVPPPSRSGSGAGQLQPPPNGRKIIQSAQLSLGAPADRIDDVAQEVFNVIGSANGIVDSSTVTATGGPDGSAQFQLRVPSSSLAQAMAQLSKLKYANVVSRTDNTQDVNSQFGDASKRLADAQALRTSLLKQLANATTQTQIDSLKAQIHDAEATIASAQASLRSLNSQVNLSRISLTISASGGSPPVAGGGFTIGKAAHDAGRVLTVAAGVALIALAALVPVSLVVALGWWIAATVRRRRREQSLDLA
jgi:hypothetical protein